MFDNKLDYCAIPVRDEIARTGAQAASASGPCLIVVFSALKYSHICYLLTLSLCLLPDDFMIPKIYVTDCAKRYKGKGVIFLPA